MNQVFTTLFCVGISKLLAAQTRYTINCSFDVLPDNSKAYLIHSGQRKIIDSGIVMNETFVLNGHNLEATHTLICIREKLISLQTFY